MPLMLILLFADTNYSSSRAFLILITDTAENEHFSLQVCLIFLTLLFVNFHVSNTEQCSENLGTRVPVGI